MTGVMIVTGGSRGIGAATARMAAARGYAVCVNYQGKAAAAAAVVDEISAAGGRALAVQANIGREEEVEALFEWVDRDLGPVTALVNNAGITGHFGRLDETSSETLQQVVDVNLLGVMWCCRAAVRRMSKRHGGQGGGIVNLSSAAATLGSPGTYVWYAASKAAVDTLTLGLALELAREGIRVNAVAPGYVDTEIHASSGMPDRVERDADLLPLGRAARADEIAEPILWLLSEAASYTTGTVLRVGGGR